MKGTKSGGYTILEVLIFVAVSGLMFVMSAIFINGKQATAEFKQGMSDINSQLQQTINEVANGYYPSADNVTCTASGGSGALNIGGSSTEKGTNKDCVFLGKLIQFGVTDQTAGTDMHAAYNIYTVAGRRTSRTDGQVPSNFKDSQPEIVDLSSVTEEKALQWGVHLTAMFDTTGGASQPICGIGFFGSFATTTSGSLESGAQTVIMKPDPKNNCLRDASSNFINNFNPGAAVQLDNDTIANHTILLCFMGTGRQYATITFNGAVGQRLKPTMQVFNDSNLPPGICPNADSY